MVEGGRAAGEDLLGVLGESSETETCQDPGDVAVVAQLMADHGGQAVGPLDRSAVELSKRACELLVAISISRVTGR